MTAEIINHPITVLTQVGQLFTELTHAREVIASYEPLAALLHPGMLCIPPGAAAVEAVEKLKADYSRLFQQLNDVANELRCNDSAVDIIAAIRTVRGELEAANSHAREVANALECSTPYGVQLERIKDLKHKGEWLLPIRDDLIVAIHRRLGQDPEKLEPGYSPGGAITEMQDTIGELRIAVTHAQTNLREKDALVVALTERVRQLTADLKASQEAFVNRCADILKLEQAQLWCFDGEEHPEYYTAGPGRPGPHELSHAVTADELNGLVSTIRELRKQLADAEQVRILRTDDKPAYRSITIQGSHSIDPEWLLQEIKQAIVRGKPRVILGKSWIDPSIQSKLDDLQQFEDAGNLVDTIIDNMTRATGLRRDELLAKPAFDVLRMPALRDILEQGKRQGFIPPTIEEMQKAGTPWGDVYRSAKLEFDRARANLTAARAAGVPGKLGDAAELFAPRGSSAEVAAAREIPGIKSVSGDIYSEAAVAAAQVRSTLPRRAGMAPELAAAFHPDTSVREYLRTIFAIENAKPGTRVLPEDCHWREWQDHDVIYFRGCPVLRRARDLGALWIWDPSVGTAAMPDDVLRMFDSHEWRFATHIQRSGTAPFYWSLHTQAVTTAPDTETVLIRNGKGGERTIAAPPGTIVDLAPDEFVVHGEVSNSNIRVGRAHDLYTGYDPTAPDSIKDGNGEVCLGLCKVCGQGECELEPVCPGNRDWMQKHPDYAPAVMQGQPGVFVYDGELTIDAEPDKPNSVVPEYSSRTIVSTRAEILAQLEDPPGCASCGAIAGSCAAFPNCAGNPQWVAQLPTADVPKLVPMTILEWLRITMEGQPHTVLPVQWPTNAGWHVVTCPEQPGYPRSAEYTELRVTLEGTAYTVLRCTSDVPWKLVRLMPPTLSNFLNKPLPTTEA